MKCNLADICEYAKDKIDVTILDEDIYISTENMMPNKGGITRASSLPTIAQTQAFLDGDVLVSNIRPYFKKIWFAEFNGGCSNDVLVFRAKDGVNKRFLYYVLANDTFFDYSMATSKGTKMPRGDKVAIMKYDVPDFTYEKQEKIARILDVLDRKIQFNTEINKNLHQQYMLLVDRFISQLDSYDIKPLSDIADCQNGRAFYKEGYDNEGAFVMDLGNVNTSGNFVFTNADKYISLDRYNQEKLERYRVLKNDLVMVMTDRKSTMDLLGKVGKIYKDGYYLLNQRMYRIRAKNGINVNYLYACLNSTETSNNLKEKALGSVQKYVNTGDICDLKIKIPPKDVMEKLSEILNPIFLQMENNILQNEILVETRDILLPKLMSNEIDVSTLNI